MTLLFGCRGTGRPMAGLPGFMRLTVDLPETGRGTGRPMAGLPGVSGIGEGYG